MTSVSLRLTSLFSGPYKIDLPEQCLQKILEHKDGFKTPLVFCMSANDNLRYAGVREFTAAENEVSMNTDLAGDLGLEIGDNVIVKHVDLVKGTALTLDVLTEHTAELDLKSLLESWIPQNYTALGPEYDIKIDYAGKKHHLRVESLVPSDVPAVCVVDTDIDLRVNDPLKVSEQPSNGSGLDNEASEIQIDFPVTSSKLLTGQIPLGMDYVYFSSTELGLIGPENATSFRSFVAVSNDDEVKVPVDQLGLRFSVLGTGELLVSSGSQRQQSAAAEDQTKSTAASTTETICEFCSKSIPTRNFVLHTNFCSRNSVSCSLCNRKFGQTRQVPDSHQKWHAITDHSNALCECTYEAHSVADLALHRATICPHREILCRFCHLLVPQGASSPIDWAMGLCAHESECGNRTTECYLCHKRVRLRSLDTHIENHEQERLMQPVPRLCANRCCPNTNPQAMGGLCNACFGPLSVPGSNNDPQKLKQRILRRYILQMTRGCGKTWCTNKYCAVTTKRNAKDAMSVTKTLMEGPVHYFCVNEESTQRRMFVDFEDGCKYAPGWRALAIMQCNSETDALQWLQVNAN